MYPIIFQYKFITIGSYGVMLGLSVYFGFLLAEREMILRKKDPELCYKILIFGIPLGLLGAKIFHIMEQFDSFLHNPWEMIFSGSGLSVYGSFILPVIFSYFLIKHYKEKFLEIADIAAPSLALGYAVGRFGCHASGDGCYGIPTTSFLGNAYPNGYIPVSFDVYPTPLIESLTSFIFLGILLNIRKKSLPAGFIFFLYLILNGVARFSVEFIRRNPKVISQLSHAQIIAIIIVIIGTVGIYYIKFNKKTKIAS